MAINATGLSFLPILSIDSQLGFFDKVPPAAEEQIQETEAAWEKDLERVAPDQQDKYKAKIRTLGIQLRERAKLLVGLKPHEIRSEMQRMVSECRALLEPFYAANAAYEKEKEEERKSSADFAAKLRLAVPSSILFMMPETETDEHGSDLSSTLSQWANGKTAHHIEHRFGKTQGYAAEFLTHLALGPVPEGTTSVWRDRLVSTAAHIGISEAVKCFLPGKFQAYTVILGANLVAEAGKAGEQSLEKLVKQDLPREAWYRQWALSGQEGPTFTSAANSAAMLAKGMQVPHQILHAVHHEVVALVAKLGDEIGLTDEAVAKAAERAFQWIDERGQRILEQEKQHPSMPMDMDYF